MKKKHHCSTTDNVLAFCKQYFEDHGYAPSVREIGNGVGLQSPSSVHYRMKELLETGAIATEHPSRPRAFRIAGRCVILSANTEYHIRQRISKPVTDNVFCFCKDYFKSHGYAPSIQEIGDGVGVKSTSSVHHHMRKLFDIGVFETDHPSQQRAFRIKKFES